MSSVGIVRDLTLGCAALAVIGGIVSAHLWREVSGERAITAQLQAQLAQMVPRAELSTPATGLSPPAGAPGRAAGGSAAPTAEELVSPGQGFDRTPEMAMDAEQRAAHDRRVRESEQRWAESPSAMMGPDLVDLKEAFQALGPGRVVVKRFGRDLQAAGMPLSSAQERALIDMVNAQPYPMQHESGAGTLQRLREIATDLDARSRMEEQNREWLRRVLDVARVHLSAEQVVRLQQGL